MIKTAYRIYSIEVEEGHIKFSNGIVFNSITTSKHLKGCKRCAVIAATLGPEVDMQIRAAQTLDLAAALELDKAANIKIERVMDELQQSLPGKKIRRYSPGFGDLGLEVQKDMLTLAGVKGFISVSGSFMLEPQKSVTALVGLY